MYCTNCGSQINDGAKFCSECGASLSGNKATTKRDDTAPVKSSDDLIKFVVKTCNSVNLGSDGEYIEVGKPTIPSNSPKLEKARANFHIPDDEDVYLIFDSGDGQGLAICTSGLYYCGSSDRISSLSWQKFIDKKISLQELENDEDDEENDWDWGCLHLGRERFIWDYFILGKIKMILKDIQNYLR